MTCSGADTRDLTRVQRTFGDARIPPQLRAVTADTDLVTLGIGGNDLGAVLHPGEHLHAAARLRPAGLAVRAAARRPGPGPRRRRHHDQRPGRRAPCGRSGRKAPRAKVLLVGYLRLAPDRGTCVGLPLAAGDYAEGRRISRALDRR